MQTTLSYIALALSAATLLVTLFVAIRVKAVHYLLQQPVVKKMSPQLRLKPVKLDEAMNRDRNREGRDGRRDERRDGDRNREGRGERRDGRPEGNREGRPEGNRDGNRDGNRERRDGDRNREGRGERRDENRGERREGRPEGNRDGNREGRERRDGDRNRDGRRDENRGERREDRPRREFSETRDFAPAVSSEASAPAAESTGLPPRRPLASFDAPIESASAGAPASESAGETFVGSSDDMQHGRRTQLKKKPRFDFDEEETTAA